MQIKESMEVSEIESVRIEKDLAFVSAQDGLVIKYDVYRPIGHPHNCPIIQIAHGMVEHKGRYKWAGVSLAKQGFCVVINDHRGHGESIDENHPLGEMHGLRQECEKGGSEGNEDASKGGFKRAIADMHQLTLIAKQRFQPSFYVLLGHSMGSLLSRGYLILHSRELDALILSGSPAYNPLVGLGKALAQILKTIGLQRWGKQLVNSLSFGGFNRPFIHNAGEDNAKGGSAWLCRDKAVVEAYRADLKCSFVFSLESFVWLFEGMQWVNAKKPRDAEGKELLILSGDADSCGDFGKGVRDIAKKYENWGLKVKLKLYKDARHEILNELNKQEVLQDIVDFLHHLGALHQVFKRD